MIKKSKKVMSNLTKYLFDHHEFMDFKARYGIPIEKEVLKQNQESLMMRTIQQVGNHPRTNTLVKIGKAFKLKGISFSNNDQFIGVIGQYQIWIVDSRNGMINNIQDFPSSSKHFVDGKFHRRKGQKYV